MIYFTKFCISVNICYNCIITSFYTSTKKVDISLVHHHLITFSSRTVQNNFKYENQKVDVYGLIDFHFYIMTLESQNYKITMISTIIIIIIIVTIIMIIIIILIVTIMIIIINNNNNYYHYHVNNYIDKKTNNNFNYNKNKSINIRNYLRQ